MTNDTSTGDTEHLWPDDLELDDRLEFDGDEYVVVGTGPGEATLDRVDDDSFTIEVFRWAFTNEVGIELETHVSQEEFERSLETDTDRTDTGDDPVNNS